MSPTGYFWSQKYQSGIIIYNPSVFAFGKSSSLYTRELFLWHKVAHKEKNAVERGIANRFEVLKKLA